MILLEIALALLFAKTFDYLFEKLKQPVVIGEILAGIILGPYLIGKLSGTNISIWGSELHTFSFDLTSMEFQSLAMLGIITLLFLSGLETDFKDMKNAGKWGIITSLLDVSVAFIFGYLVGQLLGLPVLQSLAIGAVLTATSVGVSVRTLMDLDKLHTKVGAFILTIAVLDDVLGILILSIIVGQGSPLGMGIKVVIFFFITFVLGLRFIPHVIKICKVIHVRYILITIAMILCFLFAAFAESMGLAAITGAFIAGLIIGTTPQSKRILEYIRELGHAFLIPLFFVWVGASFDFSALQDVGLLVLLFIPAAFIGKIIGCTTGAKLSGFNNREALQVGIGMIPRMEVALVVVATAISLGVFTGSLAHQMLAATVLLVIVSAIATPFLLKIAFKEE